MEEQRISKETCVEGTKQTVTSVAKYPMALAVRFLLLVSSTDTRERSVVWRRRVTSFRNGPKEKNYPIRSRANEAKAL